MSDYERLPKPIQELENISKINPKMQNITAVASFPNAEAMVCFAETIGGVYQHFIYRIMKLNRHGQVLYNIEHTDTEKNCKGLLILGNILYVIHETSVETLNLSRFEKGLGQIDAISSVKNMMNSASLFHDPSQIADKDLLLLADWEKHQVFTYRLSTKHKEVHVRGLKNPRSVSYIFDSDNTFYLVCGGNEVRVYNSTWGLVRNIGNTGSRKEKLAMPTSAIILPDGNVIISDYWEHRLSEFSIEGRFLDVLVTRHHFWPVCLTFSYPDLWVLCKQNKLYMYKLYKN